MECSMAVAALGSWCSCQWHRTLTSSEDSRKCPSGASCFSLQGSSISQDWSVAGCKLAQKVKNKNLWHDGALLWELGSRELRIAHVLLVYPGSRVACVLWLVNNYRSWHDFCSICSLYRWLTWKSSARLWMSSSASYKSWGIPQVLTKENEASFRGCANANAILYSSVLSYWANLVETRFFFLYIYLLIFKCLK